MKEIILPKRTNEHVKEGISINFVEGVVVHKGWTCQKRGGTEYGIDIDVEIFEKKKPTGMVFCMQVKSTDSLMIEQNSISYDVEIKNLNYWFRHTDPIVFLIYDKKNNKAYWDFVKNIIKELNSRKVDWQKNKKSVRIKIPTANIFNSQGLDKVKQVIQRYRDDISGAGFMFNSPSTRHKGNIIYPSINKQDLKFGLAGLSSKEVEISEEQLNKILDLLDSNKTAEIIKLTKNLLSSSVCKKNKKLKEKLLTVLTKAYADSGDFDRALSTAKKSYGINPKNISILNNLTIILVQKGIVEEAIETINQALKLRLKDANIYNTAGVAYLAKGNSIKALDYFNKALDISPNFYEAKLNIGFIYRDSGRLDDAENTFKELTDVWPNFALAPLSLGNIYLMKYELYPNKNFLEKAQEAYFIGERTLSALGKETFWLKESWDMLHIGKSALLGWQYKIDESLKELQSIEQKSKNDDTYNYNMGQLNSLVEDYDSAIEYYRKSLQFKKSKWQRISGNITQSRKLASLGAAFYKKYEETKDNKWLRQAIDYIEKALSEDPSNLSAEINRCIAYLRSNRDEEAKAIFEKELKKDKPRPGFHYIKAFYYHKKRNNERCYSELKEELKVDPDGIEINTMIGLFHLDKGDFPQSIAYFEKAYASPIAPLTSVAEDIYIGLARCYSRTKGVDCALDFLLKKCPLFLRRRKKIEQAFNIIAKKMAGIKTKKIVVFKPMKLFRSFGR
ncbi:Photosystem I assembly protein Ycf3 [subsurface metagenome]